MNIYCSSAVLYKERKLYAAVIQKWSLLTIKSIPMAVSYMYSTLPGMYSVGSGGTSMACNWECTLAVVQHTVITCQSLCMIYSVKPRCPSLARLHYLHCKGVVLTCSMVEAIKIFIRSPAILPRMSQKDHHLTIPKMLYVV